MTVIYTIPTGVKTFQKSGKYVMPWSVKELNIAVKKYLALGGFSARHDKQLFEEFSDAILAINPTRSKESIYMIFYNIARCDKQELESGNTNLYGGVGYLLRDVLAKMDPGQVRFTQNPPTRSNKKRVLVTP